MNRTLIALTIGSTLTLGTLALHAQGHGPAGHGPGAMMHEWGNPLDHLTKELDLTADQQAKVAPIVDQAKPQIVAIHQEAMEKTRTVMESAGAQIRPLLNAQQQQKFDAMKKAHEDMFKAMQEMHEARQQSARTRNRNVTAVTHEVAAVLSWSRKRPFFRSGSAADCPIRSTRFRMSRSALIRAGDSAANECSAEAALCTSERCPDNGQPTSDL